MAIAIKFYLNDIETKCPPQNWQALELELNFDKDKENTRNRISITDFDFVNENADIINAWITSGLLNGVGILEGLPFRIEIERGAITEQSFNGYLDPFGTTFFHHKATLKAIDINGIDSFNDRCDSFNFEHLFRNTGHITTNDFKWCPYILNSVPNYVEAAVSVLGVYVMVKEIKAAIQRILEFIPELPVYYVFSTYVKLILYIIYLIFLIIALIKLIKQIILLIIQPVKYHACMSIKRHLEVGAEYLGMTFDSSIFNEAPFNDAYLMPQKYFNEPNKKEKSILGFTDPSITQEGFYKGSYGDLIRQCKKMFNAKVVISNGVIHMYRNDYINSANQYTLPALANNYDHRSPAFNLNLDEFKANYLIAFATDSVDKNTMHDYLGTSYQVICEPNVVNHSNMVLMKGLEEVRIEFALAKRKEELTVPEEVLNEFLKIFDTIVGALVKVVNAIITVLNMIISLVNNILKKLATIGIKMKFQLPLIPKVNMPNFKNLMSNRIGMLKIEKDMINVPKVFIMTLGSESKFNKLHAQNYAYFSAKYLYENYHFVNSFVPSESNPNGNQFYIENYTNVPFSFEDYEKVKENNTIFTANNEDAIIDSLKWNPWNQTANITMRVNRKYTTNLKQSYLEPDGK